VPIRNHSDGGVADIKGIQERLYVPTKRIVVFFTIDPLFIRLPPNAAGNTCSPEPAGRLQMMHVFAIYASLFLVAPEIFIRAPVASASSLAGAI
jgi:hypothetical protein